MRWIRSRPFLFSLLIVLALAGGSAEAAKKKKNKAVPAPDLGVSAAELRARIYEYAERFAGIVEDAADDIILDAPGHAIARNALRWKINAIPACHNAVFQDNVLASGIDVWVLTAQMADFFETGNGKDLFGEWQPVALRAARLLEEDVEQLARMVSTTGEISGRKEFVASWVADHPLDDLSFVRKSTRPLAASIIGDRKKGAFAAVGRLEHQLADLSNRFTIFSEVLPKQGRWQAELLYSEIMNTPKILRALDNADGLRVALESTSANIEELKLMVDEELGATIDVLRGEADRTLREVDRQRRDTLTLIQEERAIVLDAVTREREASIEALNNERVAMMADIDALTFETIDQTATRIEALADRLFWRVCWLVGALAVTFLVGAIVVARVLTAVARIQ
jgi:hypothetical protein